MNAEVAFAVTGNNFLLTVPGDPPLGLARWTSVMMGAKIPTLIEHLLEYVKQPAVKERLKPLEENLKPLEKALETVGACFYGISLNHVETPPSPGYEPWLVERGWNPIVARQMARLAVRHGKRVANDRARLPEVVRAIKFLARPDHHHQSVPRRVAVLLAAWNETSVIETIFSRCRPRRV